MQNHMCSNYSVKIYCREFKSLPASKPGEWLDGCYGRHICYPGRHTCCSRYAALCVMEGCFLGNYKDGKITFAISDQEFLEGIKKGPFKKKRHRALLVLLHYLALRRSEIVMLVKEDFKIKTDRVYVRIRKRLKGSRETIMIPLPRDAPFMNEVVKAVHHTRYGCRVFPYSDRTVYNIVHRVFHYPHLHRLSRITWLIDNYGILAARSWTGLSLQTLEYYAGIVNLEKAAEGLIGGGDGTEALESR